jgi:hypothetical protein
MEYTRGRGSVLSRGRDEGHMAKSKRRIKSIPKFASEAEERRFWETHDSAAYVDWSRAAVVSLPRLMPSTETISLRLLTPLLKRVSRKRG